MSPKVKKVKNEIQKISSGQVKINIRKLKAKKGIKVIDDAQKPKEKRSATVNRRKIKRNSESKSSFKKLIISKE